MASSALVRVSGSVLSVPPARSGQFRKGHPREGQTWSIESLNVLVADQNVTAVQLPRRDEIGVFEGFPGVRDFAKGDVVDFLCEVTIYGADIQVRVTGAWPADDYSSYLSEASASV